MWCYVQYFIYPNTILPQNTLIIEIQQGELAAKTSAEKIIPVKVKIDN